MFTQTIFKPISLLLCLCGMLLSVPASTQKADPMEPAIQYINKQKTKLGLLEQDVRGLRLSDTYTDAHNEVTHLYLQQTHQGIDIKDAIFGFHYRADGEVIFVANRLQKKLNSRLQTGAPVLSAEQAIQKASQHLQLADDPRLRILSQENTASQQTIFAKGNLSLHDIPVGLRYVEDEAGYLRLSWQVEIYETTADHYWVVQVDAQTGVILDQQDLVIHCEFDHAAATTEACAHDYTLSEKKTVTEHEATFNAIASPSVTKTNGNGHFYRVYDAPVETPSHGGRSLVFTNGDPVASPYGWHHDGTLSYLFTKGNNVHAYEDQSGANAGAPAIGGTVPGQSLNFDFNLDLNKAPATYTNAAITNLFYWNNLIHDIMYRYGFTEVAGNFQMDNLGRGGIGNDGVMAEAQDGGGTNNANFLTLPDGAPGRMQMYLWGSSAPSDLAHIESSPTYPDGGFSFTGIPAAFGPEIDQNGVSGELVLVVSNADSYSDCSSCGCGIVQDPAGATGIGAPPSNDVNGKIVLIDRGDCAFVEKVMGAQMGGAVGVIVANHTPGAGAISMGGGETSLAETIIIPSIMISFEDGALLKSELSAGQVNMALRNDVATPPMRDGDLDNGIIVHEYGHGISTRLTGGPSTGCLGGDEQAGEGWSDYFGLMLTMDPATVAASGFNRRGIGTYVISEPVNGNGIRPAPYSRDMNINAYTYGDLNNTEISVPHGVGFMFATVLWDMTWNLIDTYGYNADIVNGSIADGNVLALQLVMDGLKLQPCSPTFLESRDAILAADQALTGGANQCLIWKAFAKRGMGFSAVSGTNSRGDEVEAFDMPPSCLPQLNITKTASHQQIENGGTITYMIQVDNIGGEAAHNILITDPLSADLQYVSGSASHGGYVSSGQTVIFPSFSLGANQSRSLSFRAIVNAAGATELTFADNMEDGQSNWSALPGANMWTMQNNESYSGDFAWFAADPDNASNQLLTLAADVTLPPNAELRFHHKFNTEAGFDGGVIELSSDGGTSWYDLGNLTTQNGYTDFIPAANNALINGFAFGGNSHGWIETVVNLQLFAGQTVNIRFRMSSDVLTPLEGWYVDDVLIATNATFVTNTAYLQAAGGLVGESSVSSMVVSGNSAITAHTPTNSLSTDLPQSQYDITSEELQIRAFPNPSRDFVNLQLSGLQEGKVDIHLISLQGQLMQTRQLTAEASDTQIQLDLDALPKGIYLVRIHNQSQQQTTRITIQ